MSNSLEVTYKNNGSYNVVISRDYSELGSYVTKLFPNLQRICIVTDSNVSEIYLKDVKAALDGCCGSISQFIFEAGEKSKNLATVNACYDHLLSYAHSLQKDPL